MIFLFPSLYISSIFPTSIEHRNIVQLCTRFQCAYTMLISLWGLLAPKFVLEPPKMLLYWIVPYIRKPHAEFQKQVGRGRGTWLEDALQVLMPHTISLSFEIKPQFFLLAKTSIWFCNQCWKKAMTLQCIGQWEENCKCLSCNKTGVVWDNSFFSRSEKLKPTCQF